MDGSGGVGWAWLAGKASPFYFIYLGFLMLREKRENELFRMEDSINGVRFT